MNRSIALNLEKLWHHGFNEFNSTLELPEVVEIREQLSAYNQGRPVGYSLLNFLMSMDFPLFDPSGKERQKPDFNLLESELHKTYLQDTHTKTYICPLNFIDQDLTMEFGSSRLGRCDPDKLQEYFHKSMIYFRGLNFDIQKLTAFNFLIINEEYTDEHLGEARTGLFAFMNREYTFGGFLIHKQYFPKVVEDAIFYLLLAPWEEVLYESMDSIPTFSIPWVYETTDDILHNPHFLPDITQLAFEPKWFSTPDGVEIEREVPIEIQMHPNFFIETTKKNEDNLWGKFEAVQDLPLFSKPIKHFFIRFFMSEGVDQLLALLTAIEAALALEMDLNTNWKKENLINHKNTNATRLISIRLNNLLGGEEHGKTFAEMYKLRNKYIHGHMTDEPISNQQMGNLYGVARKMILKLIDLSHEKRHLTREEILISLSI